MDYEADFKNTVRETIEALRARNKPMTSVTANGIEHAGWRVDSRSKNSEKGSYAGWHEEYWEQAVTLLLPDGTFKEVGSWASESNDGKKESSEFVYDRALNYFVGDRGKPFSAWKAKLERLPYQ